MALRRTLGYQARPETDALDPYVPSEDSLLYPDLPTKDYTQPDPEIVPDPTQPDPPTAPTPRPTTMAEWEAWFRKLVQGKAPTPAILRSLEAELAKMGVTLAPNAAGVAGKIRLPDGTVIDVIEGADRGGVNWQWLTGGGTPSPQPLQPPLPAPPPPSTTDAGSLAVQQVAAQAPATFYEPPAPFVAPTFTPPAMQAPTFQAPAAFSYPDLPAPGPFSYPDFAAPGPFSYPDFAVPAPFSYQDFTAPGPFTYPEFAAPSSEDVLAEDPGYQFRAREGQRALENAAAAEGILRTGGTLKDLMTYAQGLASQEYGNAFNRKFGTWGANRANAADTYKTNWANDLTTYGTNRSNAADVYDRNLQTSLTDYGTNRSNAADVYDRNLQTQLTDYQLGLTNAAQTYDRNWANTAGAYQGNRGNAADIQDRLWRNALTDYSLQYGRETDAFGRALDTFKTNLSGQATGYGFGLDVAAGKAGGLEGAQTLQGNLALGSQNAAQNAQKSYFDNLLSLYDLSTRNLPTYTPYSTNMGFSG